MMNNEMTYDEDILWFMVKYALVIIAIMIMLYFILLICYKYDILENIDIETIDNIYEYVFWWVG